MRQVVGFWCARDVVVVVCIEREQVVPTKVMASSLGKRKTPTELRLEQLKRHQASKVGAQHESSDTQGLEVKKRETVPPSRSTAGTRVANNYSSVHSEESLGLRSLRSQKKKDISSGAQHDGSHYEGPVRGKGCSDSLALFARSRTFKGSLPFSNGPTKNGTLQDGGGKEDFLSKSEEKRKRLHDCTFRDVRDLSNSQSLLKIESSIDMVEALKKLAPRKALGTFDFNAAPPLPRDVRDEHNDQSAADNGPTTRINSLSRSRFPITSGPAEDAQAWVSVKGSTAPLDLSLKIFARFTSPDSFHWCHRLSSDAKFHGVQQFTQGLGAMNRKIDKCKLVACPETIADTEKLGATLWNSLHSWVYPQSSLPPAVLSVMSTTAARGGEAEGIFLSKRYRAWEAAYRSLYNNFCCQACSLFYVCMQQFVAIFVGGGVGGRSRDACTAYLTRSTRGVRQVLLEHDIKFSMPFNASVSPTTTVEDLQDLLEFEKSNPGQTRVVNERQRSDSGPQSMLCFEGFSDVHRFYDFLLNHRSLLNITTAMDVPVLYAPTAFDNASLSVPEMTCKQLQRTDYSANRHLRNGKREDSLKCTETTSNTTYTMEINGTFLPPWVISRLCGVLQDSQRLGFSVRFATDPLTEGLNIAQEELTDNEKPANFKNFFATLTAPTNPETISNTKSESPTSSSSEFNQPSGVGTAVVKELKFGGGSYKAVLAPLQLAASI